MKVREKESRDVNLRDGEEEKEVKGKSERGRERSSKCETDLEDYVTNG